MEPKFEHNLEAEIAELSREIETKRRQLETENGVTHDRAVIQAVVAEKLIAGPAGESANIQVSGAVPKTDDYLSSLSDETIDNVNALISDIPNEGLTKTIERAKNFDPLVLDAFHDALVTKLYAELQTRGLLK